MSKRLCSACSWLWICTCARDNKRSSTEAAHRTAMSAMPPATSNLAAVLTGNGTCPSMPSRRLMTKPLARTPQMIAPMATGVSQRCDDRDRGGERVVPAGAPATLKNNKLTSTVSMSTTLSTPRPGMSAIEEKLPSSLSLTAFLARAKIDGCDVEVSPTLDPVGPRPFDVVALWPVCEATPGPFARLRSVRVGSHQVRV